MEHFAGKLAVVTGGGTGMGRELARQLSAEGCHVAMCDVSAVSMAETVALSETGAPAGTVVSSFAADVADEQQLIAFRKHVEDVQDTDHLDLLFNNAGIGGSGSFIRDPRDEWEKVFAVCLGGVDLGTRTCLPLLLSSDAGHVINTSSVNGFWATLAGNAHTAYSAAKFAVKGFTEALISDFRQHAPHLQASVVMPGHVGTSIIFNSGQSFGRHPRELGPDDVAELRERWGAQGLDLSAASDEDVRNAMVALAEGFWDNAPLSASAAATIILDGVRAGECASSSATMPTGWTSSCGSPRRRRASRSSWSASSAAACSATSPADRHRRQRCAAPTPSRSGREPPFRRSGIAHPDPGLDAPSSTVTGLARAFRLRWCGARSSRAPQWTLW